MDTLTANPPPQRDSSAEWNQPDIYAVLDSDHTSFDEKVFQQARDLHIQIENYLKALPVNDECIVKSVDALVGLDCPLPAKFSKVNVVDLIKKNKNIKGSESLSMLVSALGLLEKYGRNLMKPQRPHLWKFINFANSVFRTRVDIIKGSREVLQLMGYSEVVEDGLSFPLDVESPHFDTVATVTTDLAIAKRETELYNQGDHPHAYRFKDCLDGTMAMIQVASDPSTGRPKNVFMRRTARGTRTIYENFNILQPPGVGYGEPFQRMNRGRDNEAQTPSASTSAGVMAGSGDPSKPPYKLNPYTSSVNPASQVEGILRKIGEPTPSLTFPPADAGLAYFATSPGSVPRVQNTTSSTSHPSSKLSTQIMPSPSVQQLHQRRGSDKGSRCVMCGNPIAKLQCSTCSGLRCESCDKQWHLHPDRRAHKREVIEPTPVIVTTLAKPPSPVILCHVCGMRSASVFCTDCSSSSCSGKYCSDCDTVYHGHPLRQGHKREPLESGNSRPAVQPPPKNIVLSPVTLAAATESSSAAAKKKPVPAPRRSFNKSPAFREPLEPLIPEGQVLSDDVFMTEETRETRSDIRGLSHGTAARTQSDSTSRDISDDPPSPKPYHSLPSTKMDIFSEVEALVQMDIKVLQKIQARRETMGTCDKSSPRYSALQTEISSLMSEHSSLRKRQQELEKIIEAGSSSAEVAEETRKNQPVMVKLPPAKHYPQSQTNQPSDVPTSQIKCPPAESVVPGNADRAHPPVFNAAVPSRSANQNSQPAYVGVPIAGQGHTMTKPAVAAKPPSISPTSKQTPTVAWAETIASSPPTLVPLNRPEVTPSQPPLIDHTPSAVQPGLVQQMINSVSMGTPQTGGTINSNQTPSGPWVCLQCGNHNPATSSSSVCMTCWSPLPAVTSQRLSVTALGQQLSAAIPMPIPQHQLQTVPFQRGYKPVPTAQPKAEVSWPSVGAAASAVVVPIAKTQTEPMNVFTYLQLEEEAMLKEKQKAKEEYERQLATENEEAGMPSPPPRTRKEAKKNQTSAQPVTALTPSTTPEVINQGGVFLRPLPQDPPAPSQPILVARRHIVWAEEKRRLDEQRAQSLEFIKMLRDAEDSGFFPEEVVAASKQMTGDESQTIEWLQGNWEDYITTVTAMATNHLQKEVGKSVDRVRKQEVKKALRKHYGNVEKAAEECVTEMQEKVLNLVGMGFSHKRVCESLSLHDGGIDDALITLQQERAADFINRIWLAEDAAQQERMIVDLGVDRHPDTVERRLRILLAEYELPSWGRAVTATQLIQTGKYDINDAITAAKECGDIERAKQYLEKECTVCYSQFAMNKLSTLIHCQCMICLECLHTHFEIVINNRNILKANCPACDKPDLRGSDLEATADYFGFLDILLKGILDPGSYQLFQDKMRDWNLMKEKNFRWCAHCGNGFINEAPNRRKMRCNECNKLTCFQCKKPWMEQHENISCVEFQTWKEANDPNRAAEGLAIHLKENGIDCPHCKMRYELAKGGCMHFRCVQCTHEFCSGCSSPFKTDCSRFASCLGKGLHAHHPRDCLFYLRDNEVKALQKLLQKHNVDYKRDNPANQQPECSVMEQKELPDGLLDDRCGRETLHAGLCHLHYKEYLVSRINQSHIDPADEYGIEELTTILERYQITVLVRADREAEGAYKAKLLQEVKEHLPLEKKNPRDRGQTM